VTGSQITILIKAFFPSHDGPGRALPAYAVRI